MRPTNIQDQLVKYLTDVHSIEQQALAQMKAAPKIAGDERLANVFAAHLTETEEHERLVRERLEAKQSKPSTVKDLVGTLTGLGFGVFAAAQPDTPGKLVVHAFSYEHMEEAAYVLLGKVAELAGDRATVQVAQQIGRQEHEMADRLAGCFDLVVDAALRDLPSDDIQKQLDKYLADAHAIESQALTLLKKGPALAGAGELASAYEEHLAQTEEHSRLVAARLEARGDSPSAIKDAVLRLGALNWGAFFGSQPDTPAKLAAFTFAFENLEIAAYELLRRVAARAGDRDTEQTADRIIAEERLAAARVRAAFDQALDASLREQSVAVAR